MSLGINGCKYTWRVSIHCSPYYYWSKNILETKIKISPQSSASLLSLPSSTLCSPPPYSLLPFSLFSSLCLPPCLPPLLPFFLPLLPAFFSSFLHSFPLFHLLFIFKTIGIVIATGLVTVTRPFKWTESSYLYSCFEFSLKVKVKVAQLCPTLCDPIAYTVLGILQARILEWVAFPFSRGSSQPRNQTQVPTLKVDTLSAEPQRKPDWYF